MRKKVNVPSYLCASKRTMFRLKIAWLAKQFRFNILFQLLVFADCQFHFWQCCATNPE